MFLVLFNLIWVNWKHFTLISFSTCCKYYRFQMTLIHFPHYAFKNLLKKLLIFELGRNLSVVINHFSFLLFIVIDNSCLLLMLALTYHVSMHFLQFLLLHSTVHQSKDWLKLFLNDEFSACSLKNLPAIDIQDGNHSIVKKLSNEWTYLLSTILNGCRILKNHSHRVIRYANSHLQYTQCIRIYINMSLWNSNEFFDENAMPCTFWINF